VGDSRNYHGIELTARKRFSHRWLMNSRFTYNHTRFFYPTIADFANGVNGINANTGDPTNYDLRKPEALRCCGPDCCA